METRDDGGCGRRKEKDWDDAAAVRMALVKGPETEGREKWGKKNGRSRHVPGAFVAKEAAMPAAAVSRRVTWTLE